ncbi:MAG: PBP1A family penicillin-binding protein [Lautropia mirabilis]|nr:PBP1A family penicillin-binding protein [Lautropia mirabilis]
MKPSATTTRSPSSRTSSNGAGARQPGRRRPQAPRRHPVLRFLGWTVALSGTLVVSGALVGIVAYEVASSRLPPLTSLTDYKPKLPMQVFSADGLLIGEYGSEKRTVVSYSSFPEKMRQAILAAEDDDFFTHHGIDLFGVARAVLANVKTGGRGQGASTITMQLARTTFLSRERSFVRKFYEVLLTLRIEQQLSKSQIFEIYANQIFLGQRSYGFATAAQTYFGKPLSELTIGQMAMLAGLPKAPARDNPIANPERAKQRQRYVLSRMRTLGFITEPEYQAALNEELKLHTDRPTFPLQAQWASEMARALVADQFKEDAYTGGLKVYTTIRAKDQQAANAAVQRAVFAYDRKQGYRGPESMVDLKTADELEREERIEEAVAQAGDVGKLLSAVVLKVTPQAVTVSRGRGVSFDISGQGLAFVNTWLNPKAPANRQLRPGAVVRITEGQHGWEITQAPEVEAAMITIDTNDGAIRAMVGGYDFSRSKFNRATQSIRQPGSVLKPFIYSAALEKGFMTSTVVNDAPIILDPATTGNQLWEPKNYGGGYDGPMTLRNALARSKNMVSIRILQDIGVDYAQDYLGRFGIRPERNPAYLTMALGAGSVTPMQIATGMATFANGGYRLEPYLIDRITDTTGREVAKANPVQSGDENALIIDPRNAFLMDSMLKTVAQSGTAARVTKELKRKDLAGKTGTTNDSRDAWFAGYATGVAGVAWLGYDRPRSLGERETGGGLALPIWIDYLKDVLPEVPQKERPVPHGVVQVNGEYYLDEAQPSSPGVKRALGIAEDGLSSDVKDLKDAQQTKDQIF